MRAPLEFRPSVLALIGGGLLAAGSLAGQMAGVLMLRSGDDKASLGWWLILIMVAFQVGAVHMILEWKNRLVRVTDEWIEITDSLGRLHGPIAWSDIDEVVIRRSHTNVWVTLHYGSEKATLNSGVRQWQRLKVLMKGYLGDKWPKPNWLSMFR